MFNNTALRISFIISLSLHLFAISVSSLFQDKSYRDKPREIEVTYLALEEETKEIKKIIEKLPQKYDLEEKKIEESAPKKKIAKEEKVPAKPEVPLEKEEYLAEKELAELEEYIQYYRLVRERIKKYVAKNYTVFVEEGRVDIAFTLNRKGLLKNIRIDESKSTKSHFLRKTALESIKEASPFPPFPQALKKEELTFSLAIIFKRD